MKSPPLSASRMADVAAATISSTLWESARRRNLASVCRAAVMAVGVRLRPSRPPAPRRTISFSLSITSKDRSGLTRTTIIWIEFVPMSMAAMRMQDEVERQGWLGTCLLQRRYILALRSSRAASYHEPLASPGPPLRTPHRGVTSTISRRGGRQGHGCAPGPRGLAPLAGSDSGPHRRPPAHQGGQGAAQDPSPDAGAGYGARTRCHAAPHR